MAKNQLTWDENQISEFMEKEFPEAFMDKTTYELQSLEWGHLNQKMVAGPGHLRPGGTVSGPAQLELADHAVYYLLLAQYGEQARLCVTTNLTCSFLRKPDAGGLYCHVEMIKQGKTLSVADVRIKTGKDVTVSHMELTYYTGNVVT